MTVGKPTHLIYNDFNKDPSNFSVCGISLVGNYKTDNIKEVNCIRCKKTNIFKMRKENEHRIGK